MSRVLFLMRHAQAEHSAPGLGDYYRPLTPAGREVARGQAQYLGEVTSVLVSGAARTRQTVSCLGLGVETEPDRELYNAGSSGILDLIRRTDDTVTGLLVVGHNPGIPVLVDQLAGPCSDPAAVALARNFPPATLCRLEVTGSWADLDEARLTHTYRERYPSER